jgi:hypothetical protein
VRAGASSVILKALMLESHQLSRPSSAPNVGSTKSGIPPVDPSRFDCSGGDIPRKGLKQKDG